MGSPIEDQASIDARWMEAALAEARRGIGLTSPNPPVGAVLVKDGIRIGAGYHRKAGEPHAEIEAIRDALARSPKAVPGSTLYITLEPCCTTGKTPPCTEAIKAGRIARVVYGCQDPNPAHAGRADDVLALARIAVTSGVCKEACQEIIRPFSKWVRTGIPYVIAKAGQSLDGRITRPEGESSWITSDSARAHGRRIRQRVDAIIIGAETLRRDNPRLTLRDGGGLQGKEQPYRVILSRSGVLPEDAIVFTDEHKDRTLIFPAADFTDVLRQLGQLGVVSVLVEGGGIILGQAFTSRQVDEVIWYVAPRICGGGRPSVAGIPLAESIELKDVRVLTLGNNVCMQGYTGFNEA
jgi:diaminohydroxyphosphoribosylaminopyrimidine deaminase / 5-amino-6-(5-phosphoribosylamino)uracil reductase